MKPMCMQACLATKIHEQVSDDRDSRSLIAVMAASIMVMITAEAATRIPYIKLRRWLLRTSRAWLSDRNSIVTPTLPCYYMYAC